MISANLKPICDDIWAVLSGGTLMAWWWRDERTRTDAIKELLLRVAADPDRQGPRVLYPTADGREKYSECDWQIRKAQQDVSDGARTK